MSGKTHVTGVTYTVNGIRLGAGTTDTVTTDTNIEFDDTIGANGGVTHWHGFIDVSEVESFGMYSDHDLTVYVNVNNNSVQEIDLLAGKLYTWNEKRTDPNPLTVDITDLYIHNDTTAVASFKMAFAIDQPSGS